jgi:hypothetical protein
LSCAFPAKLWRAQAPVPGRRFCHPRIAAAASPNSTIIGGAGTSWPPLLLEDEEDEEELLLDADEALLALVVEVELDAEDAVLLVLLVMSPEVLPP